MDIYDAINSRRSVRRYSDKPIEQDKLDRIFEAVRQSPTWANMQCQRFVLVTDAEHRARLSEYSSSEALMSAIGYKSNPSRKALAEAPLVAVACANPKDSGVMHTQNYYLVDIGIVSQTMMLAARAEGLGTVFVGIYDEDAVKGLLGIPAEVRVVGLFPIGYPLEEFKPSGPPRKTVEEIIHLSKW